MTIDEAIAKYKEIAITGENCPAHCKISCDKCVQESKQLAEWLEDYKRIKMLIPIEQALKNEYNKAIDDFSTDIINKINFEHKWLFDCKSNNADTDIAFSALITFINELAEQLKAGGVNE